MISKNRKISRRFEKSCTDEKVVKPLSAGISHQIQGLSCILGLFIKRVSGMENLVNWISGNLDRTVTGLSTFVILLFLFWFVPRMIRSYRRGTGSREIPPLPPLNLPEQSGSLTADSRGVETTGAEKPSLPEIPLSEEDRKRAQAYWEKED